MGAHVEGSLDVFLGGAGGDQLEGLEGDTEATVAQAAHAALVQVGDVLPVQDDPASAGRVETGDHPVSSPRLHSHDIVYTMYP